jgi:hypothetical protein
MLALIAVGAIALAGCGGQAVREVHAPAQPPAAQTPDPCDPNSKMMVELRRRLEASIKRAKAHHHGYFGATNSGCSSTLIPAP